MKNNDFDSINGLFEERTKKTAKSFAGIGCVIALINLLLCVGGVGLTVFVVVKVLQYTGVI